VFLKVYRNLRRYDPRYAFSTWLYRITTNHVLDMKRGEQRRREVGLEGSPEPATQASPPTERMEALERRRIVREAVTELPEPYRQVLMLFHMEGMTVAETAEALGIPEGTVKVRLMRGRKRLHDTLRKSHPEYFEGGES
jgi:RNA polymerase sigma-70 factor (ECF subfamily)